MEFFNILRSSGYTPRGDHEKIQDVVLRLGLSLNQPTKDFLNKLVDCVLELEDTLMTPLGVAWGNAKRILCRAADSLALVSRSHITTALKLFEEFEWTAEGEKIGSENAEKDILVHALSRVRKAAMAMCFCLCNNPSEFEDMLRGEAFLREIGLYTEISDPSAPVLAVSSHALKYMRGFLEKHKEWKPMDGEVKGSEEDFNIAAMVSLGDTFSLWIQSVVDLWDMEDFGNLVEALCKRFPLQENRILQSRRLLLAVFDNDVDAVISLIQARASIDTKHPFGADRVKRSPLEVAAMMGYHMIAKLLISRGAALADTRALHLAAERGHTQTVVSLIEKGCKFNTIIDGWTPLSLAARYDKTDTAVALLVAGERVYWTALHWAVKNDNVELIQYMLNTGADVNTADPTTGTKPLHLAADSVHLTFFLLDNGADIKAVSVEEFTESDHAGLYHICSGFSTPLMRAFAFDNHRVMEVLFSRGAEFKELYKPVFPLFSAVRLHMSYETMALILEHDGRINRRNDMGQTALHAACEFSDLGHVNFLLKNGSDGDFQDKLKQLPLHLACSRGDEEICKALLENQTPATINHMDINLETPLHRAIGGGFQDVALLLLQHGAKPDVKDGNLNTPLHLACDLGLGLVVDRILDIKQNALMPSVVHVDSQNIDGTTPLHLALERQDWDTGVELIKAGADLYKLDKMKVTPLQIAKTAIGLLSDNITFGQRLEAEARVRQIVQIHDAFKSQSSSASNLMSLSRGSSFTAFDFGGMNVSSSDLVNMVEMKRAEPKPMKQTTPSVSVDYENSKGSVGHERGESADSSAEKVQNDPAIKAAAEVSKKLHAIEEQIRLAKMGRSGRNLHTVMNDTIAEAETEESDPPPEPARKKSVPEENGMKIVPLKSSLTTPSNEPPPPAPPLAQPGKSLNPPRALGFVKKSKTRGSLLGLLEDTPEEDEEEVEKENTSVRDLLSKPLVPPTRLPAIAGDEQVPPKQAGWLQSAKDSPRGMATTNVMEKFTVTKLPGGFGDRPSQNEKFEERKQQWLAKMSAGGDSEETRGGNESTIDEPVPLARTGGVGMPGMGLMKKQATASKLF